MPKKKNPGPVSSTELQILEQLWDGGPKTIREICEAVYADTSPSYYATIQSLLDRLEKKGWGERDRSEFKHKFRATRNRSEFVGQQIQEVADAVCDGSITALLGQLAISQKLTETDRSELRRLIDGDSK